MKCQPLQPDTLIDDMLANRMKVNSQLEQHPEQHPELQQQHHHHRQQQLQQNHTHQPLNHHQKPDRTFADHSGPISKAHGTEESQQDGTESNYTVLDADAGSSHESLRRRRSKRHSPQHEHQPRPSHPNGGSDAPQAAPQDSNSSSKEAEHTANDSDDGPGSSEQELPYTNTMSIGERLCYDQHSICDMFGF